MKLLRPLAGYTLYDHKTNNSKRQELRTTSILDKIDEYRKKWLLHIERMPQNRIPLNMIGWLKFLSSAEVKVCWYHLCVDTGGIEQCTGSAVADSGFTCWLVRTEHSIILIWRKFGSCAKKWVLCSGDHTKKKNISFSNWIVLQQISSKFAMQENGNENNQHTCQRKIRCEDFTLR
jgi:hypothetical protein